MRARQIFFFSVIVIMGLALSPALGATVSVTVPGRANPYLAGMPPGSTCCEADGGVKDVAPADSPVQVTGLPPLSAGAVLTFSASGSVSFSGGGPVDSPDGGVFNTPETFGLDGTPSSNNIAGMLAPQNALVGVFLDDSIPTSSGAPSRLDFKNGQGTGFSVLSPGLKQPFFIGDGLTGTGSGAVQQFVVPAGATRLFLGVVDGVEWHNNTGELHVQVSTACTGGAAGPLASATLPTSRSLQVGNTGFIFATILNLGAGSATSCGITPTTNVPASFFFQMTDPVTNAVTGGQGQRAACVSPGLPGQTYVIGFTPNQSFGPTEVSFAFQCDNAGPAPVVVGLNTLLLSASPGPVPDIIAVAATINHDGIVNIPGATGTGVYAVATFNLGAGALITVTGDTGGANIPVNVLVCETDPGSGSCKQPPTTSVTTQIDTNATPTFGVFVQGNGVVPFDPAGNRIFLRLKDAGGATRGSTSAAVRTQ